MKEKLIELRRDLHAHPELSFAERRTSKIAEDFLLSHHYSVQKRFLDCGFIADLGESPRVAIRCEMDALPIQELNAVPYASRQPNVSHACGHDANVACVLGAAELISAENLPVRILMQPGEERADDSGIRGSKHAIANGALEGIGALLGIHMDPTLPSGSVSLMTIPVDRDIEFDADIHSEGFACRFTGTVTGKRKADFDRIRSSLHEFLGVDADRLTWQVNAEVVSIDAEPLLSALSSVIARSQLSKRTSWSHSFADYARVVPCFLVLLGCALPGDPRPQHTATFDIEESCLPSGAWALSVLVRELSAIV